MELSSNHGLGTLPTHSAYCRRSYAYYLFIYLREISHVRATCPHPQALSDAHTFLFEERDRLLKLQSDNDELRLQEVEDRKRIRHLLAMHGPMEQEITYNRNGKPNTVTVYPRHGQENVAKQANQKDASERVMRTVYLPAANADNLMLKVESLQAQLNEQACVVTCTCHHECPAVYYRCGRAIILNDHVFARSMTAPHNTLNLTHSSAQCRVTLCTVASTMPATLLSKIIILHSDLCPPCRRTHLDRSTCAQYCHAETVCQ